ncbi:MAG: glycoside hydrolase family 16 protein [Opitutaceae bacterium]|nr:glycoside hydrolase family 16 protein [Opitutaceae bacterium]
MKLSWILAALGLATAGLHAKPPDKAYVLAWADEFDQSRLDPARWDYRTDSKHWSTQLPANVSVRDGCLWLALKKQKSGDKEYTGAGVISKRAFKYGYYEARFKVPPTAGWHTSFWMMKHNRSGSTDTSESVQELDVCENDSINPRRYGANTHRWLPTHVGVSGKAVTTPDLSADFHVWGCEFTAEKIVYYFEGKPVLTVEATKLGEHSDQHIWLTSIASHLGKTQTVDESRLPVYAVFEYVRFYERK